MVGSGEIRNMVLEGIIGISFIVKIRALVKCFKSTDVSGSEAASTYGVFCIRRDNAA